MRIGAIEGRIRLENKRRNKDRFVQNDIVVTNDKDLNVATAENFISCRIKAVINGQPSMSGRFVHQGVVKLIKAGIPVFDFKRPADQTKIQNHRRAYIKKNTLYIRTIPSGWESSAKLHSYSMEKVEKQLQKAHSQKEKVFQNFTHQTLQNAEKNLVHLSSLMSQDFRKEEIGDRPIFLVAPAGSYLKELNFIKRYVKRLRPYTIAIAEAADGLRSQGFQSDVIITDDLKKVSRETLRSGSKLIVPEGKKGVSNELADARCQCLGHIQDTALLYAQAHSTGKIFFLGRMKSMEDALSLKKDEIGVSFLLDMWLGSRLIQLENVSQLIAASTTLNPLEWLGSGRMTTGADERV